MITILLAVSVMSLSWLRVSATMHLIMTQDFSFTPANLSVVVGDTIQWMWANGNHTTTSTSVPTGADGWDAPLNSSSTSFTYIVLVAGTYTYVCVPHQSMGMAGMFTASNPTGIPGQVLLPYFNIDGNLATGQVKLNLNFDEVQTLTLDIYDLIGNKVSSVYIGTVPAGETEKIISLSGLAKGVYLAKLEGNDVSLTRKVVLQ